MKNKKTSFRRGAVLEFVLLIMTVIFLMSALLTTMSVIASNHQRSVITKTSEKLQIDTFAEQVLKAVANKSENIPTNDTYTAKLEESEDKTNWTVTITKGEKVVLTITFDSEKTITSWEY